MDLDTFENIFTTNEIDFSIVEEQVKTELLWNSLIFELYKNRLSINMDEIEEQLKSAKKNKKFKEYLLSEIVIQSVKKNELQAKIKENKLTVTIIGRLIGITILYKKYKWLAPSILAASHNSFGIFLKYCLRRKITKIFPIKGTVSPLRLFIQEGPNGRGIISPLIINKWGNNIIISGIISETIKE